MKNWLAKFRISAALDADQAPRQSSRPAGGETQKFARQLEALDRALKTPPPRPAPDPSLHPSIMRAVQASVTEEKPRRVPAMSGLLPWAAVAGLVVAALWMRLQTPPTPIQPDRGARVLAQLQASEAPAVVLDFGDQMTGAMPAAVMAPLSNEWTKVHDDLHATAQALLASIP